MNQKIILIFIVLTILIQPWRNFVSQDDAVYAQMALSASHGILQPHPLTLASAWPQTIIGGVLLKATPEKLALPSLNLMTWIIYLGLALLFFYYAKDNVPLTISFMMFPLWVQYGASFLSDIYAAILLGLLFHLFKQQKQPPRFLILSGALIILLTLQRQTLVCFPIFWSLCLLKSTGLKRFPLIMIGASLLSVLFYKFLPQNDLQQFYIYWKLQELFTMHTRSFLHPLYMFFSFFIASGIFLLPFFELKKINYKLLFGAQLLTYIFLYVPHFDLITAGIFFTDYLPRWFSALLISCGVWGFYPLFNYLNNSSLKKDPLLIGSFLSLLAYNGFAALLGSIDIRYVMVPIITFALPMATQSGRKSILGNNLFYVMLIFIVAIITNVNNLNTVEMRWKVAKQLQEEHQLESKNISAGYGYDLFNLGAVCADNIKTQMLAKHGGHFQKTEEYYNIFYDNLPRVFEKGWVSDFIIKPSKLFGKKITLAKNHGFSNHTFVSEHEYKVLMFPSSVSVYKSEEPKLPDCLK